MGIFIILITYVVIALPGTRGLYAIEGEEAELLFTYPCESTSISLQLSNGDPFYTSTNPRSTQLPPNYVVTNQKDTRRGDSCTLHLTINPVSRKDEGTFILIPYKDGDSMLRLIRNWLKVGSPPGKASCELKNYFHEEWVSLHCTAPAGSLPGQIVCYQSSIRIPPSTAPEENDGKLDQILLARVMADPVYCCSSTSKQTKDRCECKDWGWDPLHNMILTTHSDPCFRALTPISTPPHKPSHPLNNNHISSSSGSLIPTQTIKELPTLNDENIRRSSVVMYIIIGSFVLLLIAKIFHGWFSKVKKDRKSQGDNVSSNTSESISFIEYRKGQTGSKYWLEESDLI